MPSHTSSVPHPAGDNNRRPSTRPMLENARPSSQAKAQQSIRLGASHDLPSSVTHFFSLSSSSNTAAAKKELRRQLLVLRDYCVGVSNKGKGKELLSQGGTGISKKIEASADFNSCLDVIFATSLVFTDETEDVAKDTLRSVVTRLKAVQETGDEKMFRAAIVEVVNRVLLCTPLLPPAQDATTAEESKEEDAPHQQKKPARQAAEPVLRDECLDFLTMEDGQAVLVEGRWKRWLNFYEAGYIRYVEKLIAAQQLAQEDAAQQEEKDEEEEEEEEPAVQAPTIAYVPRFTTRQNYWKSTTSAYAQFCYLLLAIYFVRTKDFSLNYLARVSKLVQYYAYQLESQDGDPIAVKEGPVEEESEEEEEEEEEEPEPQEEKEAEPEPVAVREMNDAEAQTEHPEPQEEEEEEKEEVPETGRYLPPPQFDESVTRRSRPSVRKSAKPEHRSSVLVEEEAPRQPRRRGHKCFATKELPEDLRPSEDAVAEEEKATEAADTEEHSHTPTVRRTERLDLPATAPENAEGADIEDREIVEAEEAIETERDQAQVEHLAKDAEARNELELRADVANAENAEEQREEVASTKKAIHDAHDEAAVENLAAAAAAENEKEELAQATEAALNHSDKAGIEETKKAIEEARDEAAVEALAKEAAVQNSAEQAAVATERALDQEEL